MASNVSVSGSLGVVFFTRLMAGRVLVAKAAKEVAKKTAGSTGRRRRVLRAPLKISEEAADQIKEILSSREDAFGVRLGVRTRKCHQACKHSDPFSVSDDVPPPQDLCTIHFVLLVMFFYGEHPSLSLFNFFMTRP